MTQQDGISSSRSSRITYVFINMDSHVCIVHVVSAAHCKATATTVQFMTALIKEHISMFRVVDVSALVHSNSAAMSTFEEITHAGECYHVRGAKPLANIHTR